MKKLALVIAPVAAIAMSLSSMAAHAQSTGTGAGTSVGGGGAERPVADDRLQWALGGFRDLFHHGIGFGMDGRRIQGILAVHDAQEASRLLERLGAEARHLLQGRPEGRTLFSSVSSRDNPLKSQFLPY